MVDSILPFDFHHTVFVDCRVYVDSHLHYLPTPTPDCYTFDLPHYLPLRSPLPYRCCTVPRLLPRFYALPFDVTAPFTPHCTAPRTARYGLTFYGVTGLHFVGYGTLRVFTRSFVCCSHVPRSTAACLCVTFTHTERVPRRLITCDTLPLPWSLHVYTPFPTPLITLHALLRLSRLIPVSTPPFVTRYTFHLRYAVDLLPPHAPRCHTFVTFLLMPDLLRSFYTTRYLTCRSWTPTPAHPTPFYYCVRTTSSIFCHAFPVYYLHTTGELRYRVLRTTPRTILRTFTAQTARSHTRIFRYTTPGSACTAPLDTTLRTVTSHVPFLTTRYLGLTPRY